MNNCIVPLRYNTLMPAFLPILKALLLQFLFYLLKRSKTFSFHQCLQFWEEEKVSGGHVQFIRWLMLETLFGIANSCYFDFVAKRNNWALVSMSPAMTFLNKYEFLLNVVNISWAILHCFCLEFNNFVIIFSAAHFMLEKSVKIAWH